MSGYRYSYGYNGVKDSRIYVDNMEHFGEIVVLKMQARFLRPVVSILTSGISMILKRVRVY